MLSEGWGRSAGSGALDLDTAIDSGGDCLQIADVGTHDQVVTAQGSLSHTSVKDVRGRCASGQRTDRPSPLIVERFDGAAHQQPGEESPAALSSPCLSDYGCGDRRNFTAHKQGSVTGPHAAFPTIGGNEGASVVRNAHHAVRGCRAPLPCARSIASAAHRSASASSSELTAPSSCSN